MSASSRAVPTKRTRACSNGPARPRKTCVRRGAACRTKAAWSANWKPSRACRTTCCLSYREQFNVGRRSLLDVLDAQNTRYNVQAQAESARLARLYAQYRVLAATNRLIEALGVTCRPRRGATSGRGSRSIRSRRQTGWKMRIPLPAMGPPAPAYVAPAPRRSRARARHEPAPVTEPALATEPAPEPTPSGGR